MPGHRALQDHLEQRASELSGVAETLPHGDERDDLLHRATKMQAASLIIERWMSSPGLRSAEVRHLVIATGIANGAPA
jgi:hypothetical protein